MWHSVFIPSLQYVCVIYFIDYTHWSRKWARFEGGILGSRCSPMCHDVSHVYWLPHTHHLAFFYKWVGKHWGKVIYDMYLRSPLPSRLVSWVSFTKKFWSHCVSHRGGPLRSAFQREPSGRSLQLPQQSGRGHAFLMLLSANDSTQQGH